MPIGCPSALPIFPAQGDGQVPSRSKTGLVTLGLLPHVMPTRGHSRLRSILK